MDRFRLRSRFAVAVIVVVVVAAVSAAAAFARTHTGEQNPQFRVTVTITPRRPVPGQTIVATIRGWNLTKHNHTGWWEVTWTKPDSGISAEATTTFKPGRVLTDREIVHVTAKTTKGWYVISAALHDRNGTSHARVGAKIN
ncbi:MAG TPA: hypothetical protein VGL44_12675 [Gaiellales bacterium]|jgi:hypothetical protein